VIVDSHVHVASPNRAHYPLRPSGVGSEWFRTDDVSVLDLLGLMDRHGVDRTVVVQAIGAYGHDCSYAIDAVRDYPERLCLVGSIDMDGEDPSAALFALARAAGDILRGIRLFGVLAHEPEWLRDGRADRVWELAGQLAITIVPTLFPAALPEMASVVERHPQVPTVLEHIGFVDLSGGTPFPEAGPLFDLAGHPAVRLKVTTHSLKHAESVGDPADLLDRLVATFGADRLVWGSDHPQSVGRSYEQKIALARHSARRLEAADRDRYLGTNAMTLWWPNG